MSERIVECVPNFSEGRDASVIEAIAAAVRGSEGCTLLDVDPGRSTNRTVVTFVGSPEAVVEGALAAARVARERIDMRRHSGEHPRMGAMDVCPFVPVAGVTMQDCVACARELGRRAAEELGIPIFLYEEAASQPHRKTLSQIRAGEYESLAAKLARPEWTPDFGPAELVPEWGATATGARSFLIAYNVNVLGTKEQAHRIALDVREAGRGPDQPGLLKAVKGIGWYVDEYAMAQVSMNLDDFRVTPPHAAFEACAERARSLGLGVAGSELVGLIPRDALLMAAEHYIESEGLFVLDERQKLRLAIERLGLHSVSRFDPDERVIEYRIAGAKTGPLAGSSVADFVASVGARSSAPGGGSVSALLAALGAALGAMVGWLTYGVRRFEAKDAEMRRLLPTLVEAHERLVPLIDADTAAFGDYMEALRLPEQTPQEQRTRHAAMQEGLRKAVLVPLETMRLADACWDALVEMAEHGNLASRSDLEVGARALETGIWGAWRNVLINLPGLDPGGQRDETAREAAALAARAEERRAAVLAALERRVERDASQS
jgi:glutamate formiminotransferase/formiminotetrahydrofolate cyclodeaminase